MANRLQKLALTSYTRNIPAKPAVPGYCFSQKFSYPAMTVVLRYEAVTDSAGKTRYIPIYEQRPARTEYVTTCYPSTPAVKGVPATTQYLAVNGWDSGANSIVALEGDGHFEFKVSGAPRGVVVGFAIGNSNNLPSEPSHAFYFHGTAVDLMQYGEVVASNVLVHSSSTVYRIARRGSQVTFETDGWSYESDLPSGGAVLLDVALYTSGDYVDDPALVEYANGGSASGVLPALTGVASDSAGYSFAEGSLPALTGEAAGHTLVVAFGTLPALTGYAADRPYAAAEGILPALTGEAIGGYPTFIIASAQGSLPPLTGSAHGLTGEIAIGEGTLPALSGYGADRPYASADGALPALTGLAYEGLPNNIGKITSPLAIGTVFHPSNLAVDGISSGLALGGTFGIVVWVRDGISSPLLLGGRVGGQFDAVDGYSAGLALGGRFFDSEQVDSVLGQLQAQPMQLAVNIDTGAPTLYLDFTFTGFASCRQNLYACREDGVYLIGAGDDEGQPLKGLIDFGASDFGTNQIKRMDFAYFGLDTDGSAALQVETDGGEYEYPIVQHGPMSRAKLGKGLSGRKWNLSLEFSDATYLEMDSLELMVGAAQRRLRGR
ncbi:hypothetical protein ACF8C6_09110 [Pseudomonas sp. zbq_18]|uniref:hypothetical protein n=1 Tax=Pseudomonas sp. zbq_18 TaxID=3367251 RepID=UPI00370AADDA